MGLDENPYLVILTYEDENGTLHSRAACLSKNVADAWTSIINIIQGFRQNDDNATNILAYHRPTRTTVLEWERKDTKTTQGYFKWNKVVDRTHEFEYSDYSR